MSPTAEMSTTVLDSVACPQCRAATSARAAEICCRACGQAYPRLGAIPILLKRPEEWLAIWRLQLEMLGQEGQEKLGEKVAELQSPGTLPLVAARCRAMLEAAKDEANDVVAVLDPLVPKNPQPLSDTAMKTIESPLRRVQHLCRDWGWEEGKSQENEHAISALGDVIEGGSLGRVLVLGAGGCRLAYDLHRRFAPSETVVLDVDPLLLAGACQVIRGKKVRLTETSISVNEADGVARVWELEAPYGPIAETEFHFVLADGLDPPFAPESFDTVVTPWFIDIVPRDLRDFLGTLRALVRPGGRWINTGPLLYPREVPLPRRFTRDEIFELAARAGFKLGKWRVESGSHFVAPSNGRGRVEWTLTFQATKTDAPPADEALPPSWLILPFLPVPAFAGAPLFSHDNPLILAIVQSIDGRRSIDDVAAALALQVAQAGFDPRDLREAIRHCLAAYHPACRAEMAAPGL